MHPIQLPVPHLTTTQSGPLYHLEKIMLDKLATIETWFRLRWQETPAPLTSSVDLRHAGFKLSPVDTNLFPAGFNNLNPDFMPLCIQAAQSVLVKHLPSCMKILILPESHTRNPYYLSSISVLRDILVKAGFMVRFGSLSDDITSPTEFTAENGETVLMEPLARVGERVQVADYSPCLLWLNNDLSTGIPDILKDLTQIILPTEKLGWATRLKSSHFQFFTDVIQDFSKLIHIDPWLIDLKFSAVEGIDFMAKTGTDQLAEAVDSLLGSIREKYKTYEIQDSPFVVVKADNGTYGMSVMMVQDAAQILNLNRKQRTKMSTSKGNKKVSRVLIQEGVYTFETMPDGSVAEPVVYMIGEFVVGGFYRVHKHRGKDENLNAPGMYFEPLAFEHPCNFPCQDRAVIDTPNRFYAYGVIARLAALAAAREIAAIGEIG